MNKKMDIFKNFTEKLKKIKEKINRAKRKYILNRTCIYLGENTILTEIKFGRLIYLDSRDTSVSPHIIHSGIWEPWVTEFVCREVKNGDVVIDIGANCGYFTILCAHLVGAAGFVIAFEPQKRLSQLLGQSLAVNGFAGRTRVLPSAVGETKGNATLRHIGTDRGSSSLMPNFGCGEGDEVPVVSLDSALEALEDEENREIIPNFIKIDVEGFEYFVWKGMKDMLSKVKGPLVILLEFTPSRYRQLGQSPAEFLDALKAEGFVLSRLTSEAVEFPLSEQDLVDAQNIDGYLDLVARRPASSEGIR